MRRQGAANRNDDERRQRIPNSVRREPSPVIAASLHQHAGEGRPEKPTDIAEGAEETQASRCRRTAQEGCRQTEKGAESREIGGQSKRERREHNHIRMRKTGDGETECGEEPRQRRMPNAFAPF